MQHRKWNLCKCEYKLALCGTCDDVIVYNPCFLIQLFGEQRLGVGTTPTVGSTYTVNVQPSCTQSDKLSPGEMERCTLLISSFNLRAFTSGTTTTVCTLPTPSVPVVSTSIPTGTSANLSTPELVASIVVPSFLLIMVLTVIIASLLMWMR